jgi:hypothetical protein
MTGPRRPRYVRKRALFPRNAVGTAHSARTRISLRHRPAESAVTRPATPGCMNSQSVSATGHTQTIRSHARLG